MNKLDKSQALANIAKKGKVDVAALEKEFNEIFAVLPNTPDKERQALRELNSRYSGADDKTNKFDICIVGLYNLTDFNAKSVKAALEAYTKNQEAALQQGLVKIIDGKPAAIDIKKTFGKDNIKNNNYGKPLEPSWNRNVKALVRAEGEKTFTIEEIALRGDFANTSLPPMFQLVSCNLLGDKKDGLKTARSSKFTVSSEKIDYNALLTTLAKDKIVILGDVFDEAKKHKKGEEGYYNRFIITSGGVKFMNDPKKEDGNYNGTIDDFTTDKMITVFVDGALPKPEIGQEYTFIAQSSIKNEQRKTDAGDYVDTNEEKVVLNVLGYYS